MTEDNGPRLQPALGKAKARTEPWAKASFSSILPSPIDPGSSTSHPTHFASFGVLWVPEVCRVKLTLRMGTNMLYIHQLLASEVSLICLYRWPGILAAGQGSDGTEPAILSHRQWVT